MKYSARDVEDRFEEAAQTLRRVRIPGGARGYGSSWPEVVRSAHAAYGYEEARPMRLVPGPAAISRMEETFDWLRLVAPEDARILWLRAEGVRWRQICMRAGCARATAWRRWVAALQTIANRLNTAGLPPARPQGASRGR